MKNSHKIILKNGNDDSELTIEFNCDSNTDDMITIFKTISTFLTYSQDFLEYSDEL